MGINPLEVDEGRRGRGEKMEYDITILEKGCDELGICLTQKQKGQFVRYYELLEERNRYVNLTSITEFDEVLKKHFVDSLAIVKALDIKAVSTMIDIGTGGGFPGLPLKIAFPHLQVCLLDSLHKRIAFLEETTAELGLSGIKAIHGRAEIFARDKEHREVYDLCVSRAVANLASLSEYCLPYVKTGGSFVSYKSGKIQEELQNAAKAINILGGKVENTVYFNIPDTDMERSLVVIDKVKQTPKKYPRKAGTPTKEPIA